MQAAAAALPVMDTAQVQAMVDAAAAHQVALAAVNAANALALKQAIAGIPPAGGPPPPAVGTFTLTPGLANPGQPWDHYK